VATGHYRKTCDSSDSVPKRSGRRNVRTAEIIETPGCIEWRGGFLSRRSPLQRGLTLAELAGCCPVNSKGLELARRFAN
jgi:hypothetical protein